MVGVEERYYSFSSSVLENNEDIEEIFFFDESLDIKKVE